MPKKKLETEDDDPDFKPGKSRKSGYYLKELDDRSSKRALQKLKGMKYNTIIQLQLHIFATQLSTVSRNINFCSVYCLCY